MAGSGRSPNTEAQVSFWFGFFALLNLAVMAQGLAFDQAWLVDSQNAAWMLLPVCQFSAGIAAVVFGVIGWRKARRHPDEPHLREAQIGLAAGVISVGVLLLCALAAAVFLTIFILASGSEG